MILENMDRWKLILMIFIIMIGLIFIGLALPSIMQGTTIANMPILTTMGMFGACLIVVSVVYFAENVKDGEYKAAVEFGLVGISTGFALLIAWLWT